jgi:hypothetical protein
MTRERPIVVLVMAGLNIALGGIALVLAIWGAAYLLFLMAMAQVLPATGPNGADVPQEMVDAFLAVPGYVPYVIVTTTLDSVMAVVLIISGFGLLKLRPWGRWGSIVFSAYWIPATVAAAVYTLAVLQPAMAAWGEDYSRRMGGAAGPGNDPSANNVVALIYHAFLMAYAVALLVVMFLPGVAAAFSGREDPAPADKKSPGGYPEQGVGGEPLPEGEAVALPAEDD